MGTKAELTVGVRVCVCGGVGVYTLVQTKSNCRKESSRIEQKKGKDLVEEENNLISFSKR